MADSFKDIAQQLRGKQPAISLPTKQTGLDRLYSEQRTLPRSATYPHYPTTAAYVLRPECKPGAIHSKCTYLTLVDAYVTGGDDHNDNWTFLYRLDLTAFCAAVPAAGTFPDLLVHDGRNEVDEYGIDSTTVTWQFDVINPTGYAKPALNTNHPTITTAKFVAETFTRNGPVATIVRRYEKLAVLTDFEFDEETHDPVTITRQIVHSVTVPTLGTGRDVSQRSLGTEFSLLTIRDIGAGPTAYNYYDYIDYEFPNLLVGFSSIVYGSAFTVMHSIRSRFQKKVVARIAVSFHNTAPVLSTIFQLYPISLDYPGFTFQIHENAVITDSGGFTNSGPAISETYNYGASVPTLTQYVALIGTEVLITERIAPWRYNKWRRQRIYIILE